MAVNGRDPPDAADERIAHLYREAAHEEPPARLDRLIAAAAREGPAGLDASRRTPWWLSWRVPFAFAAVAVVSVSLVTLMVEEDRDRVTAVPAPAPPAVTPAPAPPPPAAPAPPAAIDLLREAPPAPSDSRSAPAKREAQSEARKVVPAPARENAATGRLAAERDSAPLQKRSDDERREAASTETFSGAQKLPSTEPAPETKADTLRDAPARSRAAPEPFPGGERAAAQAVAPPLPAAEGPAPPASAPVAGAARPPAPAAKPAPPLSSGVRGLSEESAYRVRPSPEVARHLAELDKQPAAAWIERVLALRKEGRVAEAEGVLAELKRRYPDALLPPELR